MVRKSHACRNAHIQRDCVDILNLAYHHPRDRDGYRQTVADIQNEE
jgi:hypothetical protein